MGALNHRISARTAPTRPAFRGAGRLHTLFRIVMPMAAPGLIAAAGFRHVAETFRLLTITGAIDLFTAHRPAQDHGLTVANDLG